MEKHSSGAPAAAHLHGHVVVAALLVLGVMQDHNDEHSVECHPLEHPSSFFLRLA